MEKLLEVRELRRIVFFCISPSSPHFAAQPIFSWLRLSAAHAASDGGKMPERKRGRLCQLDRLTNFTSSAADAIAVAAADGKRRHQASAESGSQSAAAITRAKLACADRRHLTVGLLWRRLFLLLTRVCKPKSPPAIDNRRVQWISVNLNSQTNKHNSVCSLLTVCVPKIAASSS